jgi:acyl-CoA thioesterase I
VRAAVVVVSALLLAACAGGRGDGARMLPRDPGAPLLYVALGDSTVEGVGASSPESTYVARLHARLRGVYPRAAVINLGLGGATSRDVVGDQLERAIVLKPQLVTLSVGPNDITEQVPVGEYEANVETILRRLTAETRAVVVANLLPDLAVTPRFRGRESTPAIAKLTVQFNQALRRQAGRHGVELVDLYTASQAEVPRRPDLIGRDGYHPSDLGYARWAELLWTGVERRIARRE